MRQEDLPRSPVLRLFVFFVSSGIQESTRRDTKAQKGFTSREAITLFCLCPFVYDYRRGLGLGVGVGFGAGSVGDGAGVGLPLGDGLGVGVGLSGGTGLGVGAGVWLGIGLSAGTGCAAGAETSVPVAAGVRGARLLRATRVGANEHFIVVPGADVSSNRSRILRARIDTITGGVAGVVEGVVASMPI